jgi:integrase
MVFEGPEAYVVNPDSVRRTYGAKADRTWTGQGVDIEGLVTRIEGYDRHVGAQLRLQAALGLRVKEAIMCRPHESDRGSEFFLQQGTKGGRRRVIPIDSTEKRAAVDDAKALVVDPLHHLGHLDRTLKQNLVRYYSVLRKFGMTHARSNISGHGLRHEYANRVYEQIAGEPSPVKGGARSRDNLADAARQTVAEHLGHGRKQVSAAYLGGVRTVPEKNDSASAVEEPQS